MSPNFAECGVVFESNLTLYANYVYNGPVEGTWKDSFGSALMTLEGCYELCGKGPDYYSWPESSATILTWVLPVIGLIVLAPYESNAKRKTLFLMCRYIGSPLASLSYILWNIKVTGKCGLIVDMATGFEDVPDRDTAFGRIRDSLYLLGVMNQYNLRPGIPQVEAEKLLRIALFSDTLKLALDENPTKTLQMRRRKLADRLRRGRKQGAVPVFLTAIWFMFAMALSIDAAFGNIGSNATAHNLAMGLMLAWFPAIILCGIVDISPGASDEVRLKLNHLLEIVKTALLDEHLSQTFTEQSHQEIGDLAWTAILQEHSFLGDSGFFTGFAGQGRVRWHRGVAHSVLTGIEDAYVAEKGRGWLGSSQEETRHAINTVVFGPRHGDNLQGLKRFDPRELIAVCMALAIVTGSIVGSFIISYFTPTIGFGCRSAGYIIFAIIDFSIAIFEGLAWWLLREALSEPQCRSCSKISVFPQSCEKRSITLMLLLSAQRIIRSIRELLYNDPRHLLEICVLIPMEVTNTCWLVYIVVAQTFGIYNTCYCQASTWAGKGGYINFENSTYYERHGMRMYWAIGTAISCNVMAFTIAYVLKEWCVQSHLNTHDYEAASQGLRRTRRFRKYAQFLSMPKEATKRFLKIIWAQIGAPNHLVGRKGLVWTATMNRETCKKAHFPGQAQSNSVIRNPGQGGFSKDVGTVEVSSHITREISR